MRFWPATDPVQLEYERLREMTLAGTRLIGPEAERFQRGSLIALIRRPGVAVPHLVATLIEVPRPRWSPYFDPRLDALADAYALVAAVARDADQSQETAP
jgi:hypothetical protein